MKDITHKLYKFKASEYLKIKSNYLDVVRRIRWRVIADQVNMLGSRYSVVFINFY